MLRSSRALFGLVERINWRRADGSREGLVVGTLGVSSIYGRLNFIKLFVSISFMLESDLFHTQGLAEFAQGWIDSGFWNLADFSISEGLWR